MRRAISIIILSIILSLHLAVWGKTPASPVFYKTENSDEWVSHTLAWLVGALR